MKEGAYIQRNRNIDDSKFLTESNASDKTMLQNL